MEKDEEIKNSFVVKLSGSDLLDLTIHKSFDDKPVRIKQATMITSEIESILDSALGRTFNIIVDMREVMTNFVPEEEQQVYRRLVDDKRIVKSALIGGNIFIKGLVNFLVEIGGKGQTLKMFDSREAALSWLNEK